MSMDTEILIQAGLSEVQAKIYLYLVMHGQSTPTEIASKINENRTTVYAAAEKLEKLGIISQRNLEGNLPALVNFYNEHQHEPGATTFYGKEGVKMIWDKVVATKAPYYFVRSRYDEIADKEALEEFKRARAEAGIESEDITPSEFTKNTDIEMKDRFLLTRTLLPPHEYDSPIEIDIFGDNVAFINYEKDGMSTLIIREATNQGELAPKDK